MSHLMNTLTRRSYFMLLNLRGNVRAFSTPVAPSTDSTAPASSSSTAHGTKLTHKVDNFERKLLVWTGKYKKAEDVPKYVSQEVMEKTRNRTRIRLANIMMALTLVGCIIMVIAGKNAAERGESLSKENLEWHKEYRKQSVTEAIDAIEASAAK